MAANDPRMTISARRLHDECALTYPMTHSRGEERTLENCVLNFTANFTENLSRIYSDALPDRTRKIKMGLRNTGCRLCDGFPLARTVRGKVRGKVESTNALITAVSHPMGEGA
jgi:hypothetical protein